MIKKILRQSSMIVTGGLLWLGTTVASADSLTLPDLPGFPAPSFANNMVLIDDPNNADDPDTSYGGVDHKFRVSATHITVQDWVDFLNDIESRHGIDADSWGFGPMNGTNGYTQDCTNGWCYQPYAYNGSTWVVTSFNQNGANLSANEAGNLPIDWISMNMAARYLNWLATGHPDTGAFTFSNNGEPRGNWDITSFDDEYPGPRLPLEDELYKAMYRNNTNNTYYDYPLGSNSLTQATTDPSSALHNSGYGGALLWDGGISIYGQVGQETGNRWGVRDVGGNRHETTLNPNNTLETIIRGASAFQGSNISLKTTRLTQDDWYQGGTRQFRSLLSQKTFS
jgi:formylglycine-generating enzyme required for sulfatase activity